MLRVYNFIFKMSPILKVPEVKLFEEENILEKSKFYGIFKYLTKAGDIEDNKIGEGKNESKKYGRLIDFTFNCKEMVKK